MDNSRELERLIMWRDSYLKLRDKFDYYLEPESWNYYADKAEEMELQIKKLEEK